MTFDELFREHGLTAEERRSLILYLAMIRIRHLLALLDKPA